MAGATQPATAGLAAAQGPAGEQAPLAAQLPLPLSNPPTPPHPRDHSAPLCPPCQASTSAPPLAAAPCAAAQQQQPPRGWAAPAAPPTARDSPSRCVRGAEGGMQSVHHIMHAALHAVLPLPPRRRRWPPNSKHTTARPPDMPHYRLPARHAKHHAVPAPVPVPVGCARRRGKARHIQQLQPAQRQLAGHVFHGTEVQPALRHKQPAWRRAQQEGVRWRAGGGWRQAASPEPRPPGNSRDNRMAAWPHPNCTPHPTQHTRPPTTHQGSTARTSSARTTPAAPPLSAVTKLADAAPPPEGAQKGTALEAAWVTSSGPDSSGAASSPGGSGSCSAGALCVARRMRGSMRSRCARCSARGPGGSPSQEGFSQPGTSSRVFNSD